MPQPPILPFMARGLSRVVPFVTPRIFLANGSVAYPSMVAAARPPPPPMALPMAPPAMPPIRAPAPERGVSTATCWLLHTWRGTAICWLMGVLEITRPVSWAAAKPVTRVKALRRRIFFMVMIKRPKPP